MTRFPHEDRYFNQYNQFALKGTYPEQKLPAKRNPDKSKYTYFYVPNNNDPTSNENGAVVTGAGAYFRLGQYSDLEDSLSENQGFYEDFYPDRYIEKYQGQGAINAGGDGEAKGITMSCDGRILMRCHQDMYVQSKDRYDRVVGDHVTETNGHTLIDTRDSMDVLCRNGQIRIQTGYDSIYYSNIVTDNSSKPYGLTTHKSQSVRNAICLIADRGNADLFTHQRNASHLCENSWSLNVLQSAKFVVQNDYTSFLFQITNVWECGLSVKGWLAQSFILRLFSCVEVSILHIFICGLYIECMKKYVRKNSFKFDSTQIALKSEILKLVRNKYERKINFAHAITTEVANYASKVVNLNNLVRMENNDTKINRSAITLNM